MSDEEWKTFETDKEIVITKLSVEETKRLMRESDDIEVDVARFFRELDKSRLELPEDKKKAELTALEKERLRKTGFSEDEINRISEELAQTWLKEGWL
ncbi:MAG: hypothetical protein OEZ01_11895 [Candidatus Heimdallarchaeota archaeon]|nr:hypothetical protein [Candidatus Heimdallarchaeota archaeon]MDH5733672.1 hypothetical protein [Candidatus Bathyarchaeota archaeon]